MNKRIGIVGIVSFIASFVFSQEGIPNIGLLRAEESYKYVDTLEKGTIFLQPLKLIQLDRKKNVYLTLGGEYRARLEHFTNKDYTTEDLTYYSQRLDFHASLMIGKNFRLFGEVYSGYVSNSDKILLESDEIDLHQGFIEWKAFISDNINTTIRIGRQEAGYGASRLIGIREGPNMRRSFDMARVIIKKKNRALHLIYGSEVGVKFNAFDNESNIFDDSANNPELWGAYLTETIVSGKKVDFYYFGFHANTSRFNDVVGEETRHSLGLRLYGSSSKFSYNTEFVYQFGEIDNSTISAFNLETDWTYQLSNEQWKPKVGIKLDWSTGDKEINDGKIQTFNPLFVNPAIYSLAGVNTPANITSFHPNLTFYPSKDVEVYVDYALFYRTQEADALYSPPRFVDNEHPAEGISEKHIGDVVGLQVKWEINRNISFDLRSSYFLAGKYIKASGPSNNTFYISPTISFKF